MCPHCKIKLDRPPFSERNTNEVMLTIDYRRLIEGGAILKSIDELNYCELCKATKKDLEEQKSSE